MVDVSSNKIKLNTWEYIKHFFIPIFFLFIGVYTIVLSPIVSEQNVVFEANKKYFIVSIIGIVLSLIVGIIQNRRLKFEKIVTTIDGSDLENALLRTAEIQNWKLKSKKGNFYLYVSEDNPLGSCGEQITLLITKDYILFNSICNPNGKRPGIVSKGNWYNKDVLIAQIKKELDKTIKS